MKLIALNFAPKDGSIKLDEVKGVNIYSEICGDPDYEDSVYMSPGAYVNIFCKTRSKVCRCLQRLSVVRIKNPKTGASIYRKYEYNPQFKGVGDNDIVLHPASIRELASGEENDSVVGKDMCVRRGSFFAYYWKHPFHATRISMKLGVFSILLAFVSIALTIILSCPCNW